MSLRPTAAVLGVLLLTVVYLQPAAVAEPAISPLPAFGWASDLQPADWGRPPDGFHVVTRLGGTETTLPAPYARYDGLPLTWNALDFDAGIWPYFVEDAGDALRVTTRHGAFVQEHPPGAQYAFAPERIKETFVLASPADVLALPWTPEGPVLSLGFTTDFDVRVYGTEVRLLAVDGAVAWRTAPFVAWDAASRTFDDPVLRVGYADGHLHLLLNATMLAEATYPLTVDPTWSAGGGWGSSTLQDAVRDWGDNTVKIGWFADNFDDNANEAWTVETGSASFADGVMKLATSTRVKTGDAWSDLRLGFALRFAQAGTATALFRWEDGDNKYFLEADAVNDALRLKKRVGGSTTTLGSAAVTISVDVLYPVKVVAQGDEFEVWWDGSQVLEAVDTSPPATALSGPIKLATDGNAAVHVDDVRVWNTGSGTLTTPVRDAGSNRPLEGSVDGTVDAYDQVHLQVRSSADNAAWGPWRALKSDLAPDILYDVPDADRQRYYQVRAVLTSGTDTTPVLSALTVNEGSPTANPAATTGFEPWYPYVGGLVNPVDGNLVLSATDLRVQSRGFVLALQRAYNGRLASEDGPFGNGWTFAYGERLVANADGTVTWHDGDGSQHLFHPKGSGGAYDAPRGLPVRLQQLADTTYQLWSKDGTRRTFDGSGVLQRIEDRNGNALTLSYTSGQLTAVADDGGRSLTFAYDANGRVASVTDPLNRAIAYAYDADGNLVSVTDALNQVIRYGYSGDRLVHVLDEVGKRTRFVVDASDRVTEVWVGSFQDGALEWEFREWAIAYDSATDRTVTNARGFTTELTLNAFGNPTFVSGPTCGSNCGDGRGNSTASTWDGEMNAVRVEDGRGNAWTSEVDVRSNPVLRRDPGGNESTVVWEEVNTPSAFLALRTEATNFRGFTTSYAYDAKGNLVQVTNALGNAASYTYDATGFLERYRDFRGLDTTFTYDPDTKDLLTVTDPLGHTTSYGYDDAGRRTTVTTPLGRTTTTTYDADDRVVKVTDPLGNATSYGYNARGDRTSVTDPNGHTTTYAVNVTNARVEAATDPTGNATAYEYDRRGNLVAVTDANGHTTNYAYNEYDSLKRVRSPLGYATFYVYDAAGNRISRTDANGATTTYEYDGLNRLARVEYATGEVLTYAYDANGNPTSESGFGYAKTTTYDALDRPTAVTFDYGAFARTTAYGYDADGNRIWTWLEGDYRIRTLRPHADGGTIQWSRSGCTANHECVDEGSHDGDTTYVYTSAVGKIDLYALEDPAAVGEAVEYVEVTAVVRHTDTGDGGDDGGGSPCGLVCPTGESPSADGPGATVQSSSSSYALYLRVNGHRSGALSLGSSYGTKTVRWTTNPATGQAWTVDEVNGLEAGVEAADLVDTSHEIRVTQVYVTVKVTARTHHAYDAATRLTETVDPDGRTTSFGYDADGRRTALAHPNGVTTGYGYDDASRLTDQTTTASDGTVLASLAYGYDRAGNRVAVTDEGGTTTYDYDDRDWLVEEVPPSGSAVTYAYDAVGNRVERKAGTATWTYAYDDDNRLTDWQQRSDGTLVLDVTYQYDDNGNPVERQEYIPHEKTAYVYRYGYDPENRLVEAENPDGSVCTYEYGPDGERISTSCSPTTYYGYDFAAPGGFADVAAEYDANGAEQARYTHGPGVDEPLLVVRGGAAYAYHADGLGSITRMTDAAEAEVRSYGYDAFGRITSEGGDLVNNYTFAGREWDASRGLYYVRARSYDPAVGRFLQKDPAGLADGPNLYAYAGNNPVNVVDPSGRGGVHLRDVLVDVGGHLRGGGAGGGGGGGTTWLGADRCVFLWGFLLFTILGTVVGLSVANWAIAARFTNLEAVMNVAVANFIYRNIGQFAVAALSLDLGLMVQALVGILPLFVLVVMDTLDLWGKIALGISWAGRTANPGVLVGFALMGIGSAMVQVFAPGGLRDSGCMG